MLALTFQVGHDRCALDVRDIREVVPCVPLARPYGSPEWLAGMLQYRATVLPVVALHRLVGADPCPTTLSSRIIIVNNPRSASRACLGILASQVCELRRIAPPEGMQSDDEAVTTDAWVIDDGQMIRLIDLDRLLPTTLRTPIGRGASL